MEPLTGPAAARSRRIGLLMAFSCTLLWGFLAIVMKVASEDVDSLTIVWFRFTFAFAVLGAVYLVRHPGDLRILIAPPLFGVLAAVSLTCNYIGYMSGLAATTPSFAQILIQAGPLLLAIGGVVLFGERLTKRQVFGGLLAIVGFGVFYWDQYGTAVVPRETLQLGIGYLMFASVTWAAYAILQKKLVGKGYAPQQLNLLLYALPALALWPWADLGSLGALSVGSWALMAFLGVNTLLAYGALGEALKRLPAYQVSLIITLNPLITLSAMETLQVLEPSWLPADAVGALGYAGAALVLGGVAFVLLKAPRPPGPASPATTT